MFYHNFITYNLDDSFSHFRVLHDRVFRIVIVVNAIDEAIKWHNAQKGVDLREIIEFPNISAKQNTKSIKFYVNK